MKKFLIIILIILFSNNIFAISVRIKDICNIAGMRTNELIGYGIVVGLNKTGDYGKDFTTVSSVVNMLQKLGIRVPMEQIVTENCAAVIVIATLPPTCQVGEKIDVKVASIGNAKSLYGGILLMTPLKAGNGEIYAIAQGSLNVSGHNFEINNNRVGKNSPTTAFISGGATVEKAVQENFIDKEEFNLYINENDYVLSNSIIQEINKKFTKEIASTNDGKNIIVKVPDNYINKKSEFLAEVNLIEVELPEEPVIVLDQKSGSVIMGGNVPIGEINISHGNLHIAVNSKNIISQPNPFSYGYTVNTIDSSIIVEQDKTKFYKSKNTTTLGEIVKGLTEMGVAADDIIAIITNIKLAGAIKARIIVK